MKSVREGGGEGGREREGGREGEREREREGEREREREGGQICHLSLREIRAGHSVHTLKHEHPTQTHTDRDITSWRQQGGRAAAVVQG